MLVSYTKPHNCQVAERSLEPRAPDPSSLPREFLGLASKPKAGCKLTPWSMPVRRMAFLGKAMWLALFIQKEQECRVFIWECYIQSKSWHKGTKDAIVCPGTAWLLLLQSRNGGASFRPRKFQAFTVSLKLWGFE